MNLANKKFAGNSKSRTYGNKPTTSYTAPFKKEYLSVKCTTCFKTKNNRCVNKFGVIIKHVHQERQHAYALIAGTALKQ